MITSFRFHSKVRSIFVWATNTCTIIDHDPLDQLNSNSCFPHRDTSGNVFPANSVSFRSRSSNHIPVKLTTAWSITRLNKCGEPYFGDIRVYRLPSNHCGSRETGLGFEFLTSNYPFYHEDYSQSLSLPAMFFWPGDRQTDKQTNFNFVRPSFQSRELCILWHLLYATCAHTLCCWSG